MIIPNQKNLFDVNNNPGLEDFELSDYKGLKNVNFYSIHTNLQRYLKKVLPQEDFAAVDKHLEKVGKLCGGELNDLIFESHKEGKYGTLEKFDRHGNRIDEIIYCEEQKEARRIAYEAGIVNLDKHPDWKHPFHYEHRESCAYMINLNGEGGIACPLAMTEGLIEILGVVGTEEQKQKWLPHISAPDSKSHFMVGQYLTEKVGGSNLAANRTIARPISESSDSVTHAPGSKWLLHGEKWFCSNPGDVWVTTAKIEGTNTIGVFLVPRYKDNGELNGHHILRLKDIIGSRGKVTAEIEYRNVEAELLGRKSIGLAYLMKHVIAVSRIHTGLGAMAGARRAFWESRAYCKQREAYKEKIGNFSSMKRILASMQTMTISGELCVFFNWTARKNKDAVSEILSPLLKFICTKTSSQKANEAILIHGGNGILGDYSVLPRLRNDAVINETWEGTHHIISGHALKAFGRKVNKAAYDKHVNEVIQNIEDTLQEHSNNNIQVKSLCDCKDILKSWKSELDNINPKKIHEANRLAFCEKIYEVFALSRLLLQAADDLTKSRNESSIYLLISQSFIALTKYGWDGFLPDDSILLDDKKMDELIDFS